MSRFGGHHRARLNMTKQSLKWICTKRKTAAAVRWKNSEVHWAVASAAATSSDVLFTCFLSITSIASNASADWLTDSCQIWAMTSCYCLLFRWIITLLVIIVYKNPFLHLYDQVFSNLNVSLSYLTQLLQGRDEVVIADEGQRTEHVNSL